MDEETTPGRGMTMQTKRVKAGFIILAVMIVLLTLSIVAVVLVDVYNYFGLADLLKENIADTPLLWYQMFTEGGPVELMQYAMNLASVIVLCLLSGIMLAKKHRYFGRFFLFALVVAFMLLEDTGNIRHLVRNVTTHLLGIEEGYRSELGILIEVAIYGAIGFLMVFSLVRIRKLLFIHKRAFKFLIAGYFVYGAVALASATRHFNDWHPRLGDAIIDRFNLLEIEAWQIASDHYADKGRRLGFYFIDNLFEESLELLGATLLFCGFLTLFLMMKNSAFVVPTGEDGGKD